MVQGDVRVPRVKGQCQEADTLSGLPAFHLGGDVEGFSYQDSMWGILPEPS